MLSGRVTEKMVFVAIYTLVAVLVVIQGAQHTANYAVDLIFYNNYLQAWEMQLVEMRYRTLQWPPPDSDNPGAYMQALLLVMQSGGLAAPKSNTDRDYVYRINKIGERTQQILIVATMKKMVLYNLPAPTFDRLDRWVDGCNDSKAGRLTARWSTDGMTRIVDWKI